MATKRKQSKNRKQIKRQTRKFQLRVDHPQDAHVREVLDYARANRREVTMIRDAVTLYYALEQGNLDALFDAFPQYKAQLAPPAPPAASGAGDDLQQIKAMLEIVVAGRKAGELVMQSGQPVTTGKQLAGFKALAAPVDEDDDLPALTIKKDATTSTDNFMRMLGGLAAEQDTPKAAPPKAVAQKAKAASANEIADNFLNAFA